MRQDESATQEFDRARRLVRMHVARVLPVLSASEQITFIKRTDEKHFEMALSVSSLHAGDPVLAEQSAGWLLNSKSVVQASLAERALLARDSDNPQLQLQIGELFDLRGELAALCMLVPKEGEEAAHQARLAELTRQERELARKVNLAAGRPAQDDPWVETVAVRKAIASDAVLVEIARFRPHRFESKRGEIHWEPARYVAWVIPPHGSGDVRIIDLGEASEIDEAVVMARAAIEQSVSRIRRPEDDERAAEQLAMAPLASLSKLVLGPLLPALDDAREVVLCPDSQLWLAPWGALPVKEGQYAIERWRLGYVTSGRDLVRAELRGSVPKQRDATPPRIFADPDYDLDSKGREEALREVRQAEAKEMPIPPAAPRSENGLSRVVRLPGTAEEARLIAPSLQLLTQVAPVLYSGRHALEEALKTDRSPRMLVLSTHGYYLPEHEVTEHEGTDNHPMENPLLRCGLLLAGCNQPTQGAAVDDGVVTGMEIVGCDLRGTEMVVLSACQTGLGQVHNGQGVAGLRQAFQLAGVRAVVSTLWRIPDAETAVLMSDFFREMASGQSKTEALRSAQVAQIRARREVSRAAHPFYWAAFTITGN